MGFKERKYIKLSPSTLNLPGINSLLLQGSLLWNNLPREIKESLLTEEFLKRLKELGALPCSCIVCN